jgi:hypothetical protein
MIAISSLRKRECKHFTTFTGGNNLCVLQEPLQKEQYKLVMDCRQSGLSDHEWCREHGIKLSTFYTWVRRLRQNGCTDIQEFIKCLPQETHK